VNIHEGFVKDGASSNDSGAIDNGNFY